jgi:hypothetical protein
MHYRLNHWKVKVQLPEGAEIALFSTAYRLTEDYLPSYPMGTSNSCPEGKQLWHETAKSLPCSGLAEVKKA